MQPFPDSQAPQDEGGQPQQQRELSGGASGQGAASAYARMRQQRERLAREKPADDTSSGGRRHDGRK